MLDIVGAANINIEYMYAFTFRHDGRAVLVFRFDDPDGAIKALTENERGVLDDVALFERD